MPTTTMLLGIVSLALLASSPALCQLPGGGGARERAAPSALRDRLNSPRPAQVEENIERFTVNDAQKQELEKQISKLKSICPNCSTVVTIGGTTIVGANVAGTATGSSLSLDTPMLHYLRANEMKCAALPSGAKDDDCKLVSKALYQYLRRNCSAL